MGSDGESFLGYGRILNRDLFRKRDLLNSEVFAHALYDVGDR
jgi:hypothetical protein